MLPYEIHYQRLSPLDEVQAVVQEETRWLEHAGDAAASCSVLIAADHPSGVELTPSSAVVSVRLAMQVPGHVSEARTRAESLSTSAVTKAVRDAFRQLRRDGPDGPGGPEHPPDGRPPDPEPQEGTARRNAPMDGGASAVVDVGESFDQEAIPRVLEAAMGQPDGTRLVIDFSNTRTISDVALVVLAEKLRTLPGAPRVRGLRRHHHTLLQYMGLVDLISSPPGDPEEGEG